LSYHYQICLQISKNTKKKQKNFLVLFNKDPSFRDENLTVVVDNSNSDKLIHIYGLDKKPNSTISASYLVDGPGMVLHTTDTRYQISK
jgi:hypothetical protein